MRGWGTKIPVLLIPTRGRVGVLGPLGVRLSGGLLLVGWELEWGRAGLGRAELECLTGGVTPLAVLWGAGGSRVLGGEGLTD